MQHHRYPAHCASPGRPTLEPVIPSLVLGVIGMNVFAVVLVVARARAFHRPLYKPMLLNIGLSILPVFVLVVGLVATLVSLAASRGDAVDSPMHVLSVVIAVVSALVWLLLLPNASYLITELNLSHRTDDDPTPLWYDIVLVITLAMSGVLNLVVNVLAVQVLYGVMRYPDDDVAGLTQPDTRLVAVAIIMLSAVGVYLGRYLRLNSWDVTHPGSFLRKVRDHFTQQGAVKTFLGFTLVHTVFIALLYLTIGGTIIDLVVAYQQSR